MLVKTRGLKTLVFAVMMGALGNALFIISQTLFKYGQVALDLSHIGTLIAAIYGGPLTGFLAGILVGIGPGLYFGYVGGVLGFLGVLGLPIGKAMTGVMVGALVQWFRVGKGKRSSLMAILAVLLGYVPECIFTIFLFKVLVVIFLPAVAEYLLAFLTLILIKAWIEVAVMGFYMGALVGNEGFSSFLRQHFM